MQQVEFFVTPGYGDKLKERLHYSQAVRIGDRVEISGQGGWNDDFAFPDALEAEIVQAFANVGRTLASAGAGWEHVVHVNSYHTGFAPETNETMARMFRELMPNHAPIWTETGVTALGDPHMRVEIRVTAIVR